jgi:hypothetical protein
MAEYEVRTQIYLERTQHDALKRLAGEKSVSMAQLVREAVATYLQNEEFGGELTPQAYFDDPIWKIPQIADELGPSGRSDASADHDKYIYR